MASCAVLMAVYKNDDPKALNDALVAIGVLQTRRPDLIMIVVDGPIPGSLRNVITKATGCPDIPTEVIELSENMGLSLALGTGLKRLKDRFQYIIRTDADDLSRPNRIAEQIEFMDRNVEVGIASSQVSIFERDPTNVTGHRILPTGFGLIKFAMKRTPINHSAAILRSLAFAQLDYPKTRLPFEDWWISLRVLKAGWKIETIDSVHLDFRGGEDMISRRSGLQYARQELQFFSQIYSEGLMPKQRIFLNVLTRFAVRLFPARVVKFAYKHLMHR